MKNKDVKLIAHRGNIFGKDPDLENTPEYIFEAIEAGYDVEIDVWLKSDGLYLGHDEPLHRISEVFLCQYSKILWIHCKNIGCLHHLMIYKSFMNFFFHEKDDCTLTSQRYIWTYPGITELGPRSVVVSEYATNYKKEIKNKTIYGICASNFLIK